MPVAFTVLPIVPVVGVNVNDATANALPITPKPRIKKKLVTGSSIRTPHRCGH